MKRPAVLAALLFCAGLALAQSLEIITLRHRPAEQVLPELLPLLEPGAALSGRGDKLFLRTSPRNKADLLRVLEAIDQAPRRLLITVRQGGQQADDRRGGELSGDVALGRNVRIIQPGVGAVGSSTVEIRRGESVVRGRVYDSRSTTADSASQQVQTIEGGRAYIRVGQATPMAFRQTYMTPRGPAISDNVVYRDVGTGFYAEPRVVGNNVELSISPGQETPGDAPGSVNVQRLSTTVSGRLGEWISLGGISQETSGESAGTVRYGTRSRSDSREIWLKVEELP